MIDAEQHTFDHELGCSAKSSFRFSPNQMNWVRLTRSVQTRWRIHLTGEAISLDQLVELRNAPTTTLVISGSSPYPWTVPVWKKPTTSVTASLISEPLYPTKPTPPMTMRRDNHLNESIWAWELLMKGNLLVEPESATQKEDAKNPDKEYECPTCHLINGDGCI